MFLAQLNDAQKNSFLALATRVVLADGELTDQENALLDRLKIEMGGKAKAPPEEVFGNTNLANFSDRRSRVIVLMELLMLGHADSNFHSDEIKVIEELAKAFGVSGGDFAAISEWAKRQAQQLHDADALMGA